MSKLYPCVYCTEDGYCKKYSDEEVKSWCVQGPCKDERPSNADRIREMTDEGLARFFDTEAFLAPWCGMSCGYVGETPCRQCMLKWLKQEAGV